MFHSSQIRVVKPCLRQATLLCETGLAIFAVGRLRSGTVEITAVVFTAAVAGKFFEKLDAQIGHLPGGFKCEFGGGSRVHEEERKHAETHLARVERRKLCELAFYAAIPREKPFAKKDSG